MNIHLYIKKALACAFFILCGCDSNNDITLLSSYPTFGSCAIDTPEMGAIISGDQKFTVGGWAFDEKNKSLPSTLTLYFINENNLSIFTVPAKRGNKREDVAAAFKSPKLVDSGFNGYVSENTLTPGVYRIVLLQADRQTGVISCNGLNHKITIH